MVTREAMSIFGRRDPSSRAPAGMYIILDTRDLLDVLALHAPLIEAWVRSGDADYQHVVMDALLERSVWAHPSNWREGYKIIDASFERGHRLGRTMIYVQRDGRIRQAIYRTGMRRGWRELDITAKARRALRAKAKTKTKERRPYQLEPLTPREYATLRWLSDRGYDGGLLNLAGVEVYEDGSASLGALTEVEAWQFRENVENDPDAFLGSSGSGSLNDKMNRLLTRII